MLYAVFYLSSILILSTWFIYPVILKLILIFKKLDNARNVKVTNFSPSLSVIIAAHNEDKNLKKRCENIYSQNYQGEIEIIIASDGSTDISNLATKDILKKFKNIMFIDIQPQGGKARAHNIAIQKAKHDILVFTDADTSFSNDFLLNLISPFEDSDTGFVSGKLEFINPNSHRVSESVSLFWKFELFLRNSESLLGLLATGTGACSAVRKSLYQEIPPTGDEDFITPLDVILQGKKCIHVDNAIAWDELPDSPKKEFSARVRMTSKNITGTLKRWGWSSLIKHPLYSLTIFLHKIGRWLTPFFLISLLISNALLVSAGNYLFITFLILQVSFYMLGLLGLFKVNILYSQQIYSFLLANAGFLFGVLKAILGRVPQLYTPIAQQK